VVGGYLFLFGGLDIYFINCFHPFGYCGQIDQFLKSNGKINFVIDELEKKVIHFQI